MRKRFSKAEREQLGTPGTVVEWRNGGHWHPGVTTGPVITDGAWQYIKVNHAGRITATVRPGDRIDAGPTFIRLPTAAS